MDKINLTKLILKISRSVLNAIIILTNESEKVEKNPCQSEDK